MSCGCGITISCQPSPAPNNQTFGCAGAVDKQTPDWRFKKAFKLMLCDLFISPWRHRDAYQKQQRDCKPQKLWKLPMAEDSSKKCCLSIIQPSLMGDEETNNNKEYGILIQGSLDIQYLVTVLSFVEIIKHLSQPAYLTSFGIMFYCVLFLNFYHHCLPVTFHQQYLYLIIF